MVNSVLPMENVKQVAKGKAIAWITQFASIIIAWSHVLFKVNVRKDTSVKKVPK